MFGTPSHIIPGFVSANSVEIYLPDRSTGSFAQNLVHIAIMIGPPSSGPHNHIDWATVQPALHTLYAELSITPRAAR